MAKKPKVIGYSAEQAAAAKKFRETAAKNTPKEILDAFFPERVTIADIELQPIDLGTFMLLEKIGNPLAVALASGERSAIGFRHLAEAIFLMSVPQDAADSITDSPTFRETVTQFARRIPAGEILKAGELVKNAIQKAFETAIPTAPQNQKASSGGPLGTSTPAPN